jgi:hypothetical protein
VDVAIKLEGTYMTEGIVTFKPCPGINVSGTDDPVNGKTDIQFVATTTADNKIALHGEEKTDRG